MANNQITPFQLTDQFTMDNFNQRINETNTALQNKLGGIESTDYPGCYYRMVSGVVEWFNPPMTINTEYRTTERHCGKPVYKQLFSLGVLSSTTGKTEYYPFGEDESAGAHGVISADAYVTNAPGGNGGWHTVLPSFDISGKLTALVTFNGTRIELYTAANWTGFYGFVYLKYTKPWKD